MGGVLERQVPMPYMRAGVRTLLLAQASSVPYSGRAWSPPRASKQCHLAHAGGMQWRRTGGASSVGRCHELECLDEGIGKALFSAGLLADAPFDPRQQVAKDTSQCDVGSCSQRVLPDAYLQGDGPTVRRNIDG